MVEYEQEATFDIYDAQSYVDKVNEEIKNQLTFEDLTCAICLESFTNQTEGNIQDNSD